MALKKNIGSSGAAGRDWSGRQPVRYPEPDVIVLEPAFAKYKIGNTPIQRLFTGCLWAEGPAWHAQGRYLVWSDIPNNRQLRWLDDDGHVSTLRSPSNNSNGNTFDFEGRQVTCEHLRRRVVRYEHDGRVTVLADKFQGKPLNSPNDVVVHPDGSIWFSDPPYGIMGNYEGDRAAPELKEAVYRVDGKTGRMAMATDELKKPNGLCFSPDYRKLYIVDSEKAPRQGIRVFDVADDGKLSRHRQFCSMKYNGKDGTADGIRADVDGNIWAAAGWAGEGYDGVMIYSPEGQRIGRIALPEICANLCFGGVKRNRLFMAASQSLYAVYVGTSGAHVT